jgi:membrane-associated protease RseP (regulator of RpoE activity)
VSHPSAQSSALTHVALFVLTLISMMAAGAIQQGVNPFQGLDRIVHLVEGIPFAATLLAILTVHEFGHYFAARKWGVRASLPYFLPLPYISFLGTLGAVIRSRSPIPHKRALLDIGAAGPLAGFVVAVAACVIGLPLSEVVNRSYFGQFPIAQIDPFIRLGSPLLFEGLASLLIPAVGPDDLVLLSPVAFAGWVGLFITAFNLFPVGQLDGGHIVYALFGRHHKVIGRATFAVLLGLGVYGIFSYVWELPAGWPGWLFLAFFLSVFGTGHPAPYYPNIPLDSRRRRIGLFSLFVFAVCFTPVPFST